MTGPIAPFPGSAFEAYAFVEAVVHNCTCRKGACGMLIEACELHRSMVEDPNWIRHSVYARRLAERLIREEFGEAA